MDEDVAVFLALELRTEFEQVQEQRERTLKTELHGLLSLIGNDSQYKKLYMNENETGHVEKISKTETNENRVNFFIGSCAQASVISNGGEFFVRYANKNEVVLEATQRPLNEMDYENTMNKDRLEEKLNAITVIKAKKCQKNQYNKFDRFKASEYNERYQSKDRAKGDVIIECFNCNGLGRMAKFCRARTQRNGSAVYKETRNGERYKQDSGMRRQNYTRFFKPHQDIIKENNNIMDDSQIGYNGNGFRNGGNVSYFAGKVPDDFLATSTAMTQNYIKRLLVNDVHEILEPQITMEEMHRVQTEMQTKIDEMQKTINEIKNINGLDKKN
ncbi:hypothetical protein C1646_811474 [Rhizophagus diaphanus]|nr:hypothetical protein C1646_811474 [Rhizophagus diaphanus] [Rhizophagus sp. MUCL 43196]